jgi:hypothetical protein
MSVSGILPFSTTRLAPPGETGKTGETWHTKRDGAAWPRKHCFVRIHIMDGRII